jgi:hypothetical protein
MMNMDRPLRLEIGPHQHGAAAALDAVADPGLGAVDDVMVALLHRAHADGGEVGARVGLGEREAAAQLARRHARQEARLLLLGAELLHQHRHHQVRVEDAGE